MSEGDLLVVVQRRVARLCWRERSLALGAPIVALRVGGLVWRTGRLREGGSRRLGGWCGHGAVCGSRP